MISTKTKNKRNTLESTVKGKKSKNVLFKIVILYLETLFICFNFIVTSYSFIGVYLNLLGKY